MSDQPARGDAVLITGLGGLGHPHTEPTPAPEMRIQILHVTDCPQLVPLRRLVGRCLSRSGLSAAVEEIEGPYPSPTLLINGVDVTRRRGEPGPSCRLDLPAEEQILAALDAARTNSHTRADQERPGKLPGVKNSLIEEPDMTMAGRRAGACGAQSPAASSLRALCGWSPPPLAPDTTVKRRVDRILVGNVPAVAIIVAVTGLLNLAPLLPVRAGLAADGLAALSGGGWCVLNFWRCRHAHCLVTGPGWLALSVFAFAESGIGRSLIAGNEQLVFLGVLAAALVFEGGWYLARRTNAIAPGEQP